MSQHVARVRTCTSRKETDSFVDSCGNGATR
jgi:hypothetical protein